MTSFLRLPSYQVLSDIESVSEFFSVVVISFIQQIFLLIGIVFAMLQLDLQLTLVSAILVPIICLVTGVYRWIAHQNFIQVKAQLLPAEQLSVRKYHRDAGGAAVPPGKGEVSGIPRLG